MQHIFTSYCAIVRLESWFFFFSRVARWLSFSMPARGGGVGGVVATAGVRSRAVCGPKMRARPGGSVSGARRAARPQKPRRGGRRSTGCVLARLFCIICSVPLRAQKFSSFFWHDPKKPSPVRKPRYCKGVSKTTSEARARADMSRTLLCRRYSSYGVRRGAACTPKK